MNKRSRDRLLALARFLERRAAGLRAYVRAKTPRRPRGSAVLRNEIRARNVEDHRDEQAEMRRVRVEMSGVTEEDVS